MPANSTNAADAPQATSTRYLVGTLEANATLSGGCPYAKAMSAHSNDWDASIVFASPCKRWGCKSCGPRKARKMAYRVESAVPNKFITLTCNPNHMEAPRQVYDRTRRQLSEMAKVLRKKLGEFEYLRILEVTKKGMPHYHLLARCPYIPQSDLSTIWNELTNAPIVDVRKIQKCDNVFRYMVKYLCKQTYIPWTDRRASWSKNFFKPEPPFEPLDLNIGAIKRHKKSPQELINDTWAGYELIPLTPTAFLMLPPAEEMSYRSMKKLGLLTDDSDHPPSTSF